jgi:hypothetical protein
VGCSIDRKAAANHQFYLVKCDLSNGQEVTQTRWTYSVDVDISRGKGCAGICTGYGARSGTLTVEFDNEHLNQPAQPIYDEKTECAESVPHNVGFATGYTTAGIGRRKFESLRQSLEQGWCARSARRASQHCMPLMVCLCMHPIGVHLIGMHLMGVPLMGVLVIGDQTSIAIFGVGAYCNAAS